KRYVEALRKLEPFTKSHPRVVDVWILRGNVLVMLGQNEPALASAERAIGIDDGDIRAWKIIARSASALKKDVRAREAAERMREIDDNDAEAHRIAADIFMNSMRATEAVYAFERALKLAPDDAATWVAYARALRTVRRPNDARSAAE